MNYKDIFNRMNPGFFREERICRLPENGLYSELVLHLHETARPASPVQCPESIAFGLINGDLSVLREAVRKVRTDWVPYFSPSNRFLCAFDQDKIVSFCILDDMGTYDGVHIGGPGCVGTVPEYRKRGIGLETVRLATD